jgi:CRP-like cAMP-binding protein
MFIQPSPNSPLLGQTTFYLAPPRKSAERVKPGIKALEALPLFAAFSTSQITALNEIADLARLGQDEVLFREGDQVEEFNILLSGFVGETHGFPGENALTDVIAPVKPIGFASVMLGQDDHCGPPYRHPG